MIIGLLVSFWYLSQAAHAIITNVTIDDSSSDPRTGRKILYSPPSAWNSGTLCQKGPGECTATPSTDILHEGTWHESTFNPIDTSENDFPNTPLTVAVQFDGLLELFLASGYHPTLTFSGTAVYIFCALALTSSRPFGNSDMSFFIDNQRVGSFVRPAPNLSGYEYNVLVYSNKTLPPGLHELHIVNGRVNGTKSLIIIDQIVYSTEIGSAPSLPGVTVMPVPSGFPNPVSIFSSAALTSQPAPSPSQGGYNIGRNGSASPGVIIGAVLGSLSCALLFVVAFILGRRWWRERAHPVVPILPPRTPPYINQEPSSMSTPYSPPAPGIFSDRLLPVYH